VIVVVEEIQGVRVIGDGGKQRTCLVARDIQPFHDVLHELEGLPNFLQPTLVRRVTPDKVISQHPGSPDPELRTTTAVDPAADGNDDIETVKSHRPVCRSNVHFLHIAFFAQLLFSEYIANMTGDYRSLTLE
jgi:hypothetical protein